MSQAPMSPDNVKTAGRTLDLFEAFARARGPLSLTELAQLIGSPVSSAHALVRTLRARGYVYMLEDRKLIYPTKRILTIAQLIARGDPLIELAIPEMRRLLMATDETIILGKRQGDMITYLEVLESSQSIRYSARAGDTKPLHSSAIGKAMLGLLSDQEIISLVTRAGLKRVTGATIVDPYALLEDVKAGRERNLFTTRGENVEDVMGIAICAQLDNEPISIAIAGPLERLSRRESEYAKILASSVERIREIEALATF